MLPDPPLPISATIDARGDLVVTFDKPLVPGLTAGPNWFVRRTNLTRAFLGPGVVAGFTMSAGTFIDVADPGPDVVTYFAVVQDLVGTNGLPVAPFANFPLVFIP